MKTKISFTINWKYVGAATFLVWAAWMTIALKDTVSVHREILNRQEYTEFRLGITRSQLNDLMDKMEK